MKHILKTIQFEIRGKTAILILNRPAVHNAVNAETIADFEAILSEIEANLEIRSIILSGAGERTFCAGGDLRYFATLTTREACLQMSRRMQSILARLHNGKKPVIAVINGNAWGGGCEILTACHLRIAADHAQFAFRQAPNGIITGWGGGKRLFAQLGKANALRLLLSGETIDALIAEKIGLINQVVPAADLMPTALALAEKINQNPPAAVQGFLKLAAMHGVADPAQFSKLETEIFAELWMQDAFQGFVKRFLKK